MIIAIKKYTHDLRGLSVVLLAATVFSLVSILPARAQEIDSVIVELAARTTNPVGSVSARHVVVDDAGNRYAFGSFSGQVEFGQGKDGQRLEGTFGDMFVAKYDTEGTLQWIQEFESRIVSGGGGLPSAQAVGIELDQEDLYVTGTFVNTLDVGPETLVTNDNSADGFITQLDPATGQVRWVNQIKSQGSRPVIVRDISAARGNVYLTGRFSGVSEFLGQFQSEETLLSLTPGGDDMFVARYSFGGILAFAIQAGGDGAEGLSIDTTFGQSFTIVGSFFGTIRFPGTSSNPTVTLTSVGGKDGFVAKYNGSQLRRDMLVQIGGTDSDSALRVVEANRGSDTYVAGSFSKTLTIGGKSLTNRGENDNYLIKINILGKVVRVVQIGSDNVDFLSDLDADTAGNAYITGRFFGQELTIDDGASVVRLPKNQSRTPYIASLSREMVPLFGQTIQGDVNPNSIAVNGNTNIYLATEYRGAAVFGEGDGAIELPAPGSFSARGMAVARYTQ